MVPKPRLTYSTADPRPSPRTAGAEPSAEEGAHALSSPTLATIARGRPLRRTVPRRLSAAMAGGLRCYTSTAVWEPSACRCALVFRQKLPCTHFATRNCLARTILLRSELIPLFEGRGYDSRGMVAQLGLFAIE